MAQIRTPGQVPSARSSLKQTRSPISSSHGFRNRLSTLSHKFQPLVCQKHFISISPHKHSYMGQTLELTTTRWSPTLLQCFQKRSNWKSSCPTWNKMFCSKSVEQSREILSPFSTFPQRAIKYKPIWIIVYLTNNCWENERILNVEEIWRLIGCHLEDWLNVFDLNEDGITELLTFRFFCWILGKFSALF